MEGDYLAAEILMCTFYVISSIVVLVSFVLSIAERVRLLCVYVVNVNSHSMWSSSSSNNNNSRQIMLAMIGAAVELAPTARTQTEEQQ